MWKGGEAKRGEVIELENTILEKDLGVNVDNQLKFSNHIEMQVNKGGNSLVSFGDRLHIWTRIVC